MSRPSPPATRLPLAGLVLALLFLASCHGDASDPVGLDGASPQFHHRPDHAGGPGGGNGNGGEEGEEESDEEGVTVESISPDTASQGTTLDVVVRGEGFEPDSELEWELEGEATDAIVTVSQRVVNSTRLDATISVADDAPEALFDVVVRTPSGRRGVGIEMFEVFEANVPTAWTFDEGERAEAGPYKIAGDGRAGGPYVDGECGVSAIINVEGSGTDSPGDALLRTDWDRIHPSESNECDGREGRRYLVLLDEPLGDAEPRDWTDSGFGNINDVEWITQGSELTNAALNLTGCNLRFDPDRFPDTDPVQVTAIRQDGAFLGWDVESTGDHVATCAVFPSPSQPMEQGDLFRVPFRVEIRILEGEASAPF